MREWRLWMVSGLLGITMNAAMAWGLESSMMPPPSDRMEDALTRYKLHPAFAKLGRGMTNALFGWLELPLNIGQRYTPTDTGGSIVTGTVYGLVKTVGRTAVGLYETVTFLVPLPEEYAPILPTLPYFQQTRRQALPLE